MTGLSENKQIDIASQRKIFDFPLQWMGDKIKDFIPHAPNVNKIIRTSIKRLNKIKSNNDIPMRIKKKNEKMINRKIYNKIDDLHWKSINYLVNNYDNILLGDMINYEKNIFFHNLFIKEK